MKTITQKALEQHSAAIRRQIKLLNKTLQPIKFRSFNDYLQRYYPEKLAQRGANNEAP